MTKIYVGNLSYDTTEDQIKELISKTGSVESVSLITDKFSGRSKGFAFVEMTNNGDTAKAIEEANGKELDGRTLTVNEAKPPKKTGGGFGDNRFGGGGGGNRGGFKGNNQNRGGGKRY